MKRLLFITACLGLSALAHAETILAELTRRQNFMVELLTRIETETILNHEATRSLLNCVSNANNRSERCQAARDTVLAPFPQVVREARVNLALGYRDSVLHPYMGDVYTLNSSLNDLHTYKDVSWSPLTDRERQVIQGVLDGYIRDARAEADRNPKVARQTQAQKERFIRLYVRSKRVAHLEVYKANCSQIVLLQYISGNVVNDQVLRPALTKMLERSAKELETLKAAARAAEFWVKGRRSCAEMMQYKEDHPMMAALMSGGQPEMGIDPCFQAPTALLRLVDYKAAIDGMLVDNPRWQQTLSDFQLERTVRTIETVVLTGVPFLAVCILAPPLVAIPAGAAAGGLALLQSQNEYNQVRRRELSVVVNVAGNVDWQALKDARLNRNISIALLPFFGAGRYVGAGARTVLSATSLRLVRGLSVLKYARFARAAAP